MAESLWRPRSGLRLLAGILVALTLPELVTQLIARGVADKFPSLLYVGAVVVAAMLGRLVGGLLAVVVSVLLLDYYVVEPRWSFNPWQGAAYAIDFALFIGIGIVLTAVLAGTDRSRALAQHARERADFAQRQLGVIAEVSRMLAASFDLPSNVRQACQRVAEAGGWDDVIVLRHDLQYVADAKGLTPQGKPDTSSDEVAAALHTGQTQVIAANGWRAKTFGPWRYRSGLAVPLPGATQPLGVLLLLQSSKSRGYAPADLLFAGEIGARIAVAIENASRYQHQVHIAHTLQQGLLPRSLPSIPGVLVHALYQAGAGTEVGGDFYDVFAVEDNRWMAVVGDVCGKGPEAATVMSVTRATLRALALHEPSPKRLLERLNEALLAQVPDGRFVTVSCAVIEVVPAGGAKVILAQAGHPAPVIIRKGSPPVLAPAANGTLLGAFPQVRLTESAIGLEPGEVLTFYTDGIELGQVTAQDRALELLVAHGDQPASGIARRFAAAVRGTEGGKADDLVVLSLEFTAAQ